MTHSGELNTQESPCPVFDLWKWLRDQRTLKHGGQLGGVLIKGKYWGVLSTGDQRVTVAMHSVLS